MKIAENINKKNITEFDFVGLESWDCFDLIVQIIKCEFHFEQIEEIDGIAVRKRRFSDGNFDFILMHDDHVGNYAYSEKQSNNEKLRVLVYQVLEFVRK